MKIAFLIMMDYPPDNIKRSGQESGNNLRLRETLEIKESPAAETQNKQQDQVMGQMFLNGQNYLFHASLYYGSLFNKQACHQNKDQKHHLGQTPAGNPRRLPVVDYQNVHGKNTDQNPGNKDNNRFGQIKRVF